MDPAIRTAAVRLFPQQTAPGLALAKLTTGHGPAQCHHDPQLARSSRVPLAQIRRRQQHEQPHPLNSSSSSPKASVLSDQTYPFNTTWLSDRFFTGGSTSGVSEPLQFHHPQEKTLRYFPLSSGKKNCYIIPNLPSGRYYIRTFTVYDNYDGRSHSPSFDVSVEGTVVFSWRSPWSEDLARTGAYSDLFAFVADSEADICFYSIATDPPIIGSLQLIWVDPDSYDADMDTSRAVYKIDKNHLGSDVAGETAAALAAASIVFRSLDPAYSRFLLNRAVRVFEFADRHRGAYSASLHHAVCPFYCNVNGFQDELLWRAVWLHKASMRCVYRDYMVMNKALKRKRLL
ncbi:hypothetical protein PS2_032127 [Malus domestica]